MNPVQVNKACKIFVTNLGGVKVYPSNNKGDDHMVLSKYFKYIGMSTSIHMNNSKYMDVSNKRNKILDEYCGIKLIWTESHTPQQNDTEL